MNPLSEISILRARTEACQRQNRDGRSVAFERKVGISCFAYRRHTRLTAAACDDREAGYSYRDKAKKQ